VHEAGAAVAGLSDRTLRAVLARDGRFPDGRRLLAWHYLLRTPGNTAEARRLLASGPHPAFDDLGARFPMRSRRLLAALQDVCGALARWTPALADAPWLPAFVFPFLKACGRAPLSSCVELCAALLANFAPTFLEAFPMAPVPTLGAAEAALRATDPQLADHLVALGLTPERWAWPMLRSALSEVLPRTSWLRLWDGLLAAAAGGGARLVASAVAYVRLHRSTLLRVKPDAPAGRPAPPRGGVAAAHDGPPVTAATAEACALLRQHLPTDMPALEALADRTAASAAPFLLHVAASEGESVWPGVGGAANPPAAAADTAGSGPRVVFPATGTFPAMGGFAAFSVDFQLRERERIERVFLAEERRRAAAEAADAEALAASARGRAAADAAAIAASYEQRRAREAAAERAQAEAEEDAAEDADSGRRHASLAALEAGETAALEAARARRSLAAARRHEARADADRKARRRAAQMARVERGRVSEEEARARARLTSVRRGLEATAAAEEEAAAAEARFAAAEEAAVVAEWRAEEEERAARRRAREAADTVALMAGADGMAARTAIREAEAAAAEREVGLSEAAAARRSRMAVEDEADRAATMAREAGRREAGATAAARDALARRRRADASAMRSEASARREAHARMREAAETIAEAEREEHRAAHARAVVEEVEVRVGPRRSAREAALDREDVAMEAAGRRLDAAYRRARQEAEGAGTAEGVSWVADADVMVGDGAGLAREAELLEQEAAEWSEGSGEGGADVPAPAWRLDTGPGGVANPMSGYAAEVAGRASTVSSSESSGVGRRAGGAADEDGGGGFSRIVTEARRVGAATDESGSTAADGRFVTGYGYGRANRESWLQDSDSAASDSLGSSSVGGRARAGHRAAKPPRGAPRARGRRERHATEAASHSSSSRASRPRSAVVEAPLRSEPRAPRATHASDTSASSGSTRMRRLVAGRIAEVASDSSASADAAASPDSLA